MTPKLILVCCWTFLSTSDSGSLSKNRVIRASYSLEMERSLQGELSGAAATGVDFAAAPLAGIVVSATAAADLGAIGDPETV